jgi:predicted DsbA family dithiol-disulfide isomerase
VTQLTVEVFSDVACPWCYLGRHRFERALADYRGRDGAVDVEVVYRPFQLMPDQEVRPVPHRELIRAKFGPQGEAMDSRLERTAHAEGLPLDFSRTVENNTFDAHRVLQLALDEHGAARQGELKQRLLTARFAEGADLGDRATLAELAGQAGLDADLVRAYLDSDQGIGQTREQLERGRRLGITAVPTFVLAGRYSVQGAQPAETFRQVLDEVTAGLDEDGRAAATSDPGARPRRRAAGPAA